MVRDAREAEHFIAECLVDEPEWVDVLRVIEVDFASADAAAEPSATWARMTILSGLIPAL